MLCESNTHKKDIDKLSNWPRKWEQLFILTDATYIVSAIRNIQALKLNDRESLEDCEIVDTRIECSKNTSFIVISAYRPTNNDDAYAHTLGNTIIDICNKYPKDTIWVGGDMNIPDIDWEENTITGNQYKKVINEVLKSTIDDVGLEQVEDKHT